MILRVNSLIIINRPNYLSYKLDGSGYMPPGWYTLSSSTSIKATNPPFPSRTVKNSQHRITILAARYGIRSTVTPLEPDHYLSSPAISDIRRKRCRGPVDEVFSSQGHRGRWPFRQHSPQRPITANPSLQSGMQSLSTVSRLANEVEIRKIWIGPNVGARDGPLKGLHRRALLRTVALPLLLIAIVDLFPVSILPPSTLGAVLTLNLPLFPPSLAFRLHP